ncbi:RagB/SusD family nutrient uptake outer membrane protein [Porphyromonadaceae bacterium OttesenSCG-928-L07]|nr:RagB/SusD family nutrient uptake outer membrane protein [Porphyromonadaceae bacterium OttesenSCG-928-L07]MDL2251984.1 RagB/SusD family nutrient uptake outer membrane protein [Odoribacter sp. OttesenSCG-928-J03]MDL2330816.1 RagB/SusD family nutrient uptake outer membrane protein [Odoribacter sp. OttesenSCG-928-A06]
MKKIILIAIVTAFAFAGCSDFLTEEPELSQSTELTLSTYDGLDKSVLGTYSPLASAGWYGAAFVLDCEMRSGNGKINLDYSSGRYTTPYGLTYSSSLSSGLWGWGYLVISEANNVLANLEGKEGNGITLQDLDNLKAECLFLRALAHFDMVRVYAQTFAFDATGAVLGIPYVFTTDPQGAPARNTIKEVYDYVVEDLLEAERIIAADYKRSGIADARAAVTKPVIQALLSRVYLYMGKWQESADYATKVINNTTYKMWEEAEMKEVYATDIPTSGEVIFEMYGVKTNSYDAFWDSPVWMTSPSEDAYSDCASSTDLYNLYADGDIRKELFVSPEANPELYWTAKYIGKGHGTPDVSNTIILRLSEMYLNRAEAIVNGAVVAGVTAVSDLNEITSRRGAAAYTSAGKEDVFQERRKELAWEGHLWFDLARTGRKLAREDYSGLTNKDLDYPDHRWALPIPKRELDVNPNLNPNPGY